MKRRDLKLLLIILSVFIGHYSVSGQVKTDSASAKTSSIQDKVFDLVDEAPEFRGGEGTLIQTIQDSIHYSGLPKSVEGDIYLGFVIRKDGTITDVKLLQGISEACDNEVLRVVKSLPPWLPAKLDDKVVSVNWKLTYHYSYKPRKKK